MCSFLLNIFSQELEGKQIDQRELIVTLKDSYKISETLSVLLVQDSRQN